MVPIAATSGGQPIVYDPGVNVDLTSGLTYPTAVDQTVTLLFAQPLAPGSYEVELSPAIQAAAFNAAEAGALAPGDGSFAGHPVVTVTGALVVNGARLDEPGLVTAPVAAAAQKSAVVPSPFLNQLQGDLGAVLDQGLRAAVGDSAITTAVNDEILARYLPLYPLTGPVSTQQTPPSFTIIWLDPVSISLQSPQGVSLSYDLSTNALSNGLGLVLRIGRRERRDDRPGERRRLVQPGCGQRRVHGAAAWWRYPPSGFSSEDFTAELQGGQTGFSFGLGGVNAGGDTAGGDASAIGAPDASATFAAAAPSITGGGSASPTAAPETSAEATSSGLATTAAVTLESAIAGPASTGGGSSARPSPQGPARQRPPPPRRAGPPRSPSRCRRSTVALQGESAPEQLDEGESSRLPALQSVLLIVKRLLSRSSEVLGALGRKSPAAVLRQIREMLEKLSTPAAANDRGARNDAVKDANPGPSQTAPSALLGPAPVSAPAPDSSGIDIVLWDHGIDGLLQQPVPASPPSTARRDRGRSGRLRSWPPALCVPSSANGQRPGPPRQGSLERHPTPSGPGPPFEDACQCLTRESVRVRRSGRAAPRPSDPALSAPTVAGDTTDPGLATGAYELPSTAGDSPSTVHDTGTVDPGQSTGVDATGVFDATGPQPTDATADSALSTQNDFAPTGAFDPIEGATGAFDAPNEGGNGARVASTEFATQDAPGVKQRKAADSDGPKARCGNYVLKKFFAKGGMGEVWLAEDPAIGRSVALKRMLGKHADQQFRFRVEAQITGQLEHPGIVPVHELGSNAEGEPYYVMKFVQGRTLQKVIAGVPRQEADRRRARGRAAQAAPDVPLALPDGRLRCTPVVCSTAT